LKTWKEFTRFAIREYCNRRGSRTFTLKEFYQANRSQFAEFKPDNQHREEKVRQQLQFLRDDGLITFVDYSGTYTYRGQEILDGEVEEEKIAEISRAAPEKREYLIETYVRNIGWVKEARRVYGFYCLFPICQNTFKREDGTPYIEVHHIIPLFKGGEDGIWNLCVLCAHHHRMSHFSDNATREKVKKMLLQETKCRLIKIGRMPSL